MIAVGKSEKIIPLRITNTIIALIRAPPPSRVCSELKRSPNLSFELIKGKTNRGGRTPSFKKKKLFLFAKGAIRLTTWLASKLIWFGGINNILFLVWFHLILNCRHVGRLVQFRVTRKTHYGGKYMEKG